ncbi:hypothetical protein [Mucilaginibacter sp. OK098]|uniref:hypothetical protein n=1 Tax=Mucilaginibacter sp. OK098 TaxID=1855297 RepID=UPI000920133D|nr:hypothetical protein [Mucilaginibacter sp. OK098]SHN12244.1 hypothetical protein SAMN05216524_105389 [Mucilaginibacter sp. OK098]
MIKIPSIEIKALVIFNDNAAQFFRFPIKNKVRMSLWEKEARYSTPSETYSEVPIAINKETIVNIMFLSNYLNRPVLRGDEFCLGTFPIVIGNVKVLEVIDSPINKI